ncbi:MAG: D-Ala-D-Ala carboxypeptidase family metallohydrolase [Byssovorax sp.]
MSLTEDQLKSAQDYNAKSGGQRWIRADLPDEALRAVEEDTPDFALRVAAIQVEEEIYQDGKLGPRTFQALIERRIEGEVATAEAAIALPWWTSTDAWPAAEALADVSPPVLGESLDAYLDRQGCPHFSAYDLTRLPLWSRNVEPVREDWAGIIPALRLAEILRHELGGTPLLVLSGYRPRRYNKAVGGAKSSYHPWFRSVQLGLDLENGASDAQQRRLYEVAAKLFAFYGQALKMGLGFYAPKRGSQITIDTGSTVRTWQSGYVSAVVAELGLKMPSPPAPAVQAPPVVSEVPLVVLQAAREHKLGGLVRIDGGMGSRYYVFDKGVVQYSALEHKVIEVKMGG